MAKYAYEMVGPDAENGWQTCGSDSQLSSAAAAWQALAGLVQRNDPEFAASLRNRSTIGTVDHEGTRYTVTRLA